MEENKETLDGGLDIESLASVLSDTEDSAVSEPAAAPDTDTLMTEDIPAADEASAEEAVPPAETPVSESIEEPSAASATEDGDDGVCTCVGGCGASVPVEFLDELPRDPFRPGDMVFFASPAAVSARKSPASTRA